MASPTNDSLLDSDLVLRKAFDSATGKLSVDAAVSGGAKGSTTAADVTSTSQGTDRQGLDVQIRTSAGVAIDSLVGTQYADAAARGTATGTLMMGDDGTLIQSVKVDAAGELQVDVLTIPAITGTVTANAGTNLNTASLNLEATQVAMSAKLPATLGQKTMVAAMAVSLASDQSSIPVASTLTAETTKVIGTVNIAAAQTLATVTTVSTVTNLSQLGGTAIAMNAGIPNAGTQRIIEAVGLTYRASTIIPLLVAITANVPIFNIIGSATKTVTVKKITVSCMTLLAAAYYAVNVEKLSTASTGGTSTTLVATPLDATSAAATAVVKAYTAIPTKGALVGTLTSYRSMWQSTDAGLAATAPPQRDFIFGENGNSGIVLAGVAQEIALTFPIALGTAGTLSIDIEWIES